MSCVKIGELRTSFAHPQPPSEGIARCASHIPIEAAPSGDFVAALRHPQPPSGGLCK